MEEDKHKTENKTSSFVLFLKATKLSWLDKEESDGDEEIWNLQFTSKIFPSYFQQNFKVDKEEPDEDEEIYVIEPKPEPKFRRQIFRDKDRVIPLITYIVNQRKSLYFKPFLKNYLDIPALLLRHTYCAQVMKPKGDWGDFEEVGVDIEPDRKLRSKWE